MKDIDPTLIPTDNADTSGSHERVNPNELMKKLDHALRFGTEEDLMALFDSGIDINQTDFEGRTALMLCVAEGKQTAVEVLLDRGADVNFVYMYQDRVPFSSLDAAIQTGRMELAELLQSHGAQRGRELTAISE